MPDYFHPSSFGGGWLVPDDAGTLAWLESLLGKPPEPLAPFGYAMGYIVEPHALADVLALIGEYDA